MKNILILCLSLVLVMSVSAFADNDANGKPVRIYVDDQNGNDSNSGLTDTESVTSGNGSWHRVESMGIFGEDTGVKVKWTHDTPAAHWCREAMIAKPDFVHRENINARRQVIVGHGDLPMEYIEESPIAGIRIRTELIWETFTAPNGQMAERCIGIREVVEQIVEE